VIPAAREGEQGKGDRGKGEPAHDSSYRAAMPGTPIGRGIVSGLPVIPRNVDVTTGSVVAHPMSEVLVESYERKEHEGNDQHH
jgi:hypothetical protein